METISDASCCELLVAADPALLSGCSVLLALDPLQADNMDIAISEAAAITKNRFVISDSPNIQIK
ncbi:hypothetical protein [Butyricicoccus porcorum]|uniref:hypothetical protein n=1 Tax=Butyricicoccus porcorum TaxID=1945634 RepID=UPI003F4A9869